MPIKDPEIRKQRQKLYSKKYYEKNKRQIIKNVGETRKKIAKRFAEYKATLHCTRCGQNHPATLDFHHVDRSKGDVKLYLLVRNGHFWKRIMQEVDKCVVLCANCHRIHHHDEKEVKKAKRQKKLKKKLKKFPAAESNV
jgi:hypothetical protein